MPELVAAGATDVHVTLRAFNARPGRGARRARRDRPPLRRRDAELTAEATVSLVLTPFDDYPIHQTPLPVAHPATGDPNHYDRFWFNGYTEDFYFACGMAVYPNRGIIDAAFAVVHDGVQRSVFASGRIPEDRSQTRIGPLTIDVVEPLRVTRVRVDAADLGIDADVTFTARTVALEEPRQTITAGTKTLMDSTRLTQWGTWSGRIAAGGARDPDRSTSTAPRTARGACARSANPHRPRPRTRSRRSSSSGRRSTGTTAARTSSASSAATAIASSAARRCCNSSATAIPRGAPTRRRGTSSTSRAPLPTCAGRPGLRRSQGATLKLLRHNGAEELHRARAAAHVPHARARLHASRVGTRSLARRARGRLRGAQGRGARQPRTVEHPHPAGDARPLG